MNFGQAIEAMKAGDRVARSGWNGKGMHIWLRHEEGFEPHFVMLTAQGGQQPGWLASQPDMLAEDWAIA